MHADQASSRNVLAGMQPQDLEFGNGAVDQTALQHIKHRRGAFGIHEDALETGVSDMEHSRPRSRVLRHATHDLRLIGLASEPAGLLTPAVTVILTDDLTIRIRFHNAHRIEPRRNVVGPADGRLTTSPSGSCLAVPSRSERSMVIGIER